MTWTNGQKLALEQLTEIAEASGSDLEIVNLQQLTTDCDNLSIRVSYSTRHLSVTENGFPFNTREPLQINVPPSFPLKCPSVYFLHKRFAGYPHVQWANDICLYQSSEIEWVASDAMYGFVQRLNDWLVAAAQGKLDPDDAPLHPPAVYVSSRFKVVAKANTPEINSPETFWFGTAHLIKKNDLCFEISDWTALDEKTPKEINLGAAILLNQPLPMEYPSTVYMLIEELEDRGISFTFLYQLLRVYSLKLKNDDDLYIVLGAPMRRIQAEGMLKQHLAVWRVTTESAANLRSTFEALSSPEDAISSRNKFIEWAVTAKTEWCQVFEDRSEVTIRRDVNTGASWLKEKRILLLGCGALGSFLAEFIARAGAKELMLVDKDTVTPGVLVRQLYPNKHIGYTKDSSLKLQLKNLGFNIIISDLHRNLRLGVFNEFNAADYDLVIDATASRTVSIVLEKELSTIKSPPPLVSVSVSAEAKNGMVTVCMPKYPAGPIDIGRRAKIASLQNQNSEHFAKDFWPRADETKLFQPEPGCSEPTFIASAADTAFHSSSLLNIALKRLTELKQKEASCDFISLPPYDSQKTTLISANFSFKNVKTLREVRHHYQVLTAPAARRSVESEIVRSQRVSDQFNETGGLLFGAIDDSIEKIWIDAASGPPPDSLSSPQLFECGIEGTAQATEYHKNMTRGSSSFIGVWHTHPVSLPKPSQVDLSAMINILHFQENTPRHIVMLIIGHAATRPVWKYYLFRRKEFVLIPLKTISEKE